MTAYSRPTPRSRSGSRRWGGWRGAGAGRGGKGPVFAAPLASFAGQESVSVCDTFPINGSEAAVRGVYHDGPLCGTLPTFVSASPFSFVAVVRLCAGREAKKNQIY